MALDDPSGPAKTHANEPHRLDHVAIAVHSLEEALKFYKQALQLELICIETVEEQGVRVAKLDLGNTHIELLEPLGPNTPVGRFLASKGPGLHHICLGSQEIEKDLETLQNEQIRLIDSKPKIGAGGAQIAFVHPKSTGGVLLELSQPDQG